MGIVLNLINFYTTMKTRIAVKTIIIGLTAYLFIVLLFGVLYWLTGAVKSVNDKKSITELFDCVYFSFITFATIGYGDFIPTDLVSKILILIETTIAALYTPVFGGYLFYELLKRPKNILFPSKILIRHINNNIVLSVRIGNQGKPTTQNIATLEFCYVRKETRQTKDKYSQESPVFEETWFVEVLLNNKENQKHLDSLKFMYKNKKNSFIRVSVSANDANTGQPIYIYKDYSIDEISYGGSYEDVVKYDGIKKTLIDWNNFNKIEEISESKISEIKNLLK